MFLYYITKRLRGCLIFIILVLALITHAGTTGKITGTVVEKENGKPLYGVNVIVEGTSFGCATDANGYYAILNVTPGTYDIVFSMIGYSNTKYENIRIRIDQTTTLNAVLKSTILDLGESITVIGKKSIVQRDLTSTISIVGSEEIRSMPVEDFSEVLEIQAGVVRGSTGELHVRGGRSDEIVYMLDGISITDPYSGGQAIEVENEMIQELQLISGTFNAEYGQAMSGIVEIVSKEGGIKTGGNISTYFGDYYSTHTDFFRAIDDYDPLAIVNYQFSLHGPLYFKNLTFFTTGRYYDNDGWIMGLRRFMPRDSSSFQEADPDNWYIEESGDSSILPMNNYKKITLQGKITFTPIHNIKLSWNTLWNDVRYRDLDSPTSKYGVYEHLFQLNPDGGLNRFQTGISNIFQLNYTLSSKAFFTIKYSSTKNCYKHYVYSDPCDSLGYAQNPSDSIGYVDPDRLKDAQQYAFYTGGTNMEHFKRSSRYNLIKFDITSQINRLNQVKVGFELKKHHLKLNEFYIIPRKSSGFEEDKPFKPDIPFLNSIYHNEYDKKPVEFACYLQDKVELSDIIFNLGVRYDYFEPDAIFPADLRDPSNSKYYIVNFGSYQDRVEAKTYSGDRAAILDSADVLGNPWKYKYKKAKTKHQFSPRLGFSFPITDKGAMHFSHGYFFQMPSFQYLYVNPEFELAEEDISTLMGNGNLNPQQTIIYEVGLQQQFGEDVGIDITGFYKDIRNLLGAEIHQLYTGLRYARFANIDYGNTRGFTLSVSKRRSYGFSGSMSYTFQIAEGNASDPKAAFEDASSNPPVESEIQVVSLDWDQRHTMNFNFSLGAANNWSIGFIGRIGSGLPYTPALRNVRTKFENSERKKTTSCFDLRAEKEFRFGPVNLSLFCKVYNLFDIKNELIVYSDTGRSGYTLQKLYAFSVQGVNTVDEYFNRPDFYSEPRRVVIGTLLEF